MEIITALGNEKTAQKIRNSLYKEIFIPDIQYQEAVIEILEKKKEINLLILNSILPGELNLFEFINIIKYKNPNIEIIIILEEKNNKTEQFLISKGINNIYYNNKISFQEIIKKIDEINNKNIINNKIENLEKLILENNKKNKKIKSKLIFLKNKIKTKKIKNNKKNQKIISIIGAPKVGKSIFIILLSLLLKNKKILILDFNFKKNNIEKIIGKKIIKNKNKKNNKILWKNDIEFIFFSEENFKKLMNENIEQIDKFIQEQSQSYDYVFLDIGDIVDSIMKREIIKNSEKIIAVVEANLLGISETQEILDTAVNKLKIQKDNIKIVFNKHNKESINPIFLKIMFSDFEVLGKIYYDSFYNKLLNSNFKIIANKIKKNYKKIINKI